MVTLPTISDVKNSAVRFFAVLWLNNTSYTKSLYICKVVNRKCRAKNTMVQLSTPTSALSDTMHSVTDRRIDDSIMPMREH